MIIVLYIYIYTHKIHVEPIYNSAYERKVGDEVRRFDFYQRDTRDRKYPNAFKRNNKSGNTIEKGRRKKVC